MKYKITTRWISLLSVLLCCRAMMAESRLSLSADGFDIHSGDVHTTKTFESLSFGLIGYPTVKPTLADQSLTYQYTGWSAKVTLSEDASGIHFEILFTNTSDKEAELPDFNLCTLSGNTKEFMWGSNISAPLIHDQKLADGSHMAVTIDDPNSPMFCVILHTVQPFNGDCVIRFSTTGGGLDKQYGVPTVATRVKPGESTTFKCSIRFGADTASVSKETYASWAKAFPYSLKWSDRRQMLRGDLFQYDVSDKNPQGFQGQMDINHPANAKRFDDYVMAYAKRSVATCKFVDAGAWIEWDLEGKQLGMDYKGNPELIDVLNTGWSHVDESGVKLIDRFFKTFKDAGIHVGVCLRPWTLKLNGEKLEWDESVSPTQSSMNHIDYCYKRWGLDIFYLDSPNFNDTPGYRKMMLDRPDILLIPEDVLEPWLQFSAPMVWEKDNVINWVTVPRNIYGDQGWGVYYKQDITNPKIADRFINDAKLGSTILHDGWSIFSSVRTTMKLLGDIKKSPATTQSAKQ